MRPARADQQDAVPTLELREIVKHFDVIGPLSQRLLAGSPRQVLKAVDGVSFRIERGTTFGLVGESGCGKSTLARMAVGLLRPTAGEIRFEGTNISEIRRRRDMATIRRRWQIVFQDPFSSLNPAWRVRDIVAEPIRAFGLASTGRAVRERVAGLLDRVGLSPEDETRYPHEFSGGQRQRIAIARALASDPRFIVCDEPTSALDVSVQAQILNLMKDLQRDRGLTYLFISHNLAVVHHMSDMIGVMYLGRLCELAPARSVFRTPQHPYTRLLLETVPDLEMSGAPRQPLAGEVPNPLEPPSGCAFHPRCPLADDRCRRERPELRPSGPALAACHRAGEVGPD